MLSTKNKLQENIDSKNFIKHLRHTKIICMYFFTCRFSTNSESMDTKQVSDNYLGGGERQVREKDQGHRVNFKYI